MFLRDKKGFTLIELLVVIAIIGILASVVLVSLNGARQRARDGRRVAEVSQIRTALEIYFNDLGVYPTTAQTLSVLVPNYLPVLPTPPAGAGDAAYRYGSGGAGCLASFSVGTALEVTTNTVLANDIDGSPTACAVQCGAANADTVYCVQP